MAEPAFSPRKIFNDPGYANDSYLKGLGNANVNPITDVVEGLKTGIQLGNAAVDLYRKVGPEGQELEQLKLDTARAQAQTAQSQSTLEGIQAKNAVLTQQADVDNKLVSLHKDTLDKQNAVENLGLLKEAYSGMAQIQDPQSLTEFLNKPEYTRLATDKEFGGTVRNKVAGLLNQAKTPEEQVALVRAAESVSPGSGAALLNLTSSAAQQQLASPAEVAAANRQPAQNKYQQDLQKTSDRSTREVNTALSQIQPGETADYNPTTRKLTIRGSDPEAVPRTYQVPDYPKDPDTKSIINQTLQDKLQRKDYSPVGQQNSQQAKSTGVGNVATPAPTLAPPKTQTVSEVVQTPQGSQLYKMRENIVGSGANNTFDAQLNGIALYAKTSYNTYDPEVVRQMAKDMYKGTKMPQQLIDSSADQAVAFADQIIKQEAFRYATIDNRPDKNAEYATPADYLKQQKVNAGDPNLTPEQKARQAISFATSEKKSPKSVDKFTTALTPTEQQGYEAWKQTLPKRLQSTSDYDLQGFYKKNGPVKVEGDTHLTDEFKKPNHPTFSNESQYSTPENPGGTWHGDTFIPDSGTKNISFVDRPQEIPSEVLDAVEQVESAGGKHTTGPMTKYGTAKGPYQLLDSTGMEYHQKLMKKDPDYDYSTYNPYNREQARQIAQAILADEMRRFNGNLSKALTAYHSGAQNVIDNKLGPEGKAYAPKVMALLNGVSI